MAEKCTNTSSPVERWMNPYPFAPLNDFPVPFSLTKTPFESLLNCSCAPFVLALQICSANIFLPEFFLEVRTRSGTALRDTPSKGRENFWLDAAVPERWRANGNDSPTFRRTGARDETLWSRENEGAISHC